MLRLFALYSPSEDVSKLGRHALRKLLVFKFSTVAATSNIHQMKEGILKTEITWQFRETSSLLTWCDGKLDCHKYLSVKMNLESAFFFVLKVRFQNWKKNSFCALHIASTLTVVYTHVHDTCWGEIAHCIMDRCWIIRLWFSFKTAVALNFLEEKLRGTYCVAQVLPISSDINKAYNYKAHHDDCELMTKRFIKTDVIA